jgi:uncharacterized membrane-anchored protein
MSEQKCTRTILLAANCTLLLTCLVKLGFHAVSHQHDLITIMQRSLLHCITKRARTTVHESVDGRFMLYLCSHFAYRAAACRQDSSNEAAIMIAIKLSVLLLCLPMAALGFILPASLVSKTLLRSSLDYDYPSDVSDESVGLKLSYTCEYPRFTQYNA